MKSQVRHKLRDYQANDPHVVSVINACRCRLSMEFNTPAREILASQGAKIELTGVEMFELLNEARRIESGINSV
jgi:hypothetical protein